jgi:acetyl-CoA acyltransferase
MLAEATREKLTRIEYQYLIVSGGIGFCERCNKTCLTRRAAVAMSGHLKENPMAGDFNPSTPGKRVAIVAGIRTPFVKSLTTFKGYSGLDLGAFVVSELMARAHISPNEITRLIFGQVVPQISAPNIAREIIFKTPLLKSTDAYSVSRACATSTQALVNAAQAILTGEADVVICGGAESLSRPPITLGEKLSEALMKANAAKTPLGKAQAFFKLKPRDFMPKPPAIAELSTGLSMGQSAEKMAKENGISRVDQDALTLRSHQNTAKAWENAIYAQEVMSVPVAPKYEEMVFQDGIFRTDTSLEKLARLKPVFDPAYGTVTAGNSSPLTDGASALLVMREDRAKALGYESLAFIKSWAFAALDPNWQLLMGPSFASPVALDRAGLQLKDIDLIDMHEAFAAQMLSNMQAFASKSWAERYLNRSQAIGEIDINKLNIYGGSISIGHPFAATGARQALTMAHELNRRGGGSALITQCAAGGLGAAVILEK